MTQVITTIEQIAASPTDVWAFISNVQRFPEWVIGTTKMLAVSTVTVGAGTEYRERTQIGPTVSETTWRITTFHPPRVQIHESHTALMHVVLTMRLEPTGTGTQLTHRIDATMFPAVRPLGWLLERVLSPRLVRDMRRTPQQAKHIVEREQAPP